MTLYLEVLGGYYDRKQTIYHLMCSDTKMSIFTGFIIAFSLSCQVFTL